MYLFLLPLFVVVVVVVLIYFIFICQIAEAEADKNRKIVPTGKTFLSWFYSVLLFLLFFHNGIQRGKKKYVM